MRSRTIAVLVALGLVLAVLVAFAANIPETFYGESEDHSTTHDVFVADEQDAAVGSGGENVIEISARKFAYNPNIVRVNQGDEVTIRLVSEDVQHGLYLDGYDVQTAARPGEDGLLRFVANKTGRFSFRCSVACGDFHPYMIGRLYVYPNKDLFAGIAIVLVFALGSVVLTMRGGQHGSEPRLFGMIPFSWKFDLTQSQFVRGLFKSRWFPFIPIVINLGVFTIILLTGITGGFGPGSHNFGIMMVWILWWVLLMLFMVPIVGRFWCMICPFPLFGEWLQRGKLLDVGSQKSRGLGKRWPNKLRNLWPLVILFWILTWFSGFSTVRPVATFILLGGVIVAAFVVMVIFSRRAFCISLCPVSGFQGLYSNFSMCEVRVKNTDICKDHSPKTCVVGSKEGYGCPWMELPFDMNRNTYCGMCMECFKTCPYDNMAFNIRPFGADFFTERRRTDDLYGRRGTDEAFKALTMMGIMFSFLIAMQGPFAHLKDMVRGATTGGFLSYILESGITDFLVLPAIFLLFVFLSRTAGGNKEVRLKDVFVNFSYVLVPVGLAAWAAFSFGIIFANGSYLLHVISDPFAWGWNLFGTAHFPWVPFLTEAVPYTQMLALSIGLIFALDFGYKFSVQTYPSVQEARRGWIPMLAFLVILHILLFWLFIG